MLSILTRARIPLIAAIAALAGCSAAASAGTSTPATFLPSVNATVSSTEPAWGQGWVQQDGPLPVLRPDAAANERLADQMAAAAPYRWTGDQAACLNRLWMKVSRFDNFWRDGMFNGIAGLAGAVADPATPADPTTRELQASGWFAAEPAVQIAAGLADIQVYWGNPCDEQSRDQVAPAGTYPLDATSTTGPGWRGQAGGLDFDVTGGRLALTPETLESVCGVPGEPAADPPPSCARITQATTWPMGWR
jgi:hypothetical protein